MEDLPAYHVIDIYYLSSVSLDGKSSLLDVEEVQQKI